MYKPIRIPHGMILEGAPAGETGGFIYRCHYEERAEGGSEKESSSGWNDLIDWI